MGHEIAHACKAFCRKMSAAMAVNVTTQIAIYLLVVRYHRLETL